MTTMARCSPAAQPLFEEMSSWPIYDAHTHINPHRPAARDFDEILAYHYYTELAHSAGMSAEHVAEGVTKHERVRCLAEYLDRFDNTVQHSWLGEIAGVFHGFHERIGPANVERLFELADHTRDGHAWDKRVWDRTNVQSVFLTNEFDDPLEGWDTSKYVPCLRTDDLVLKLHEPATVERLRHSTQIDVRDLPSLRLAIGTLFAHFVKRGARACAISLPPDFSPRRATNLRAVTPIRRALHGMMLRPDEQEEVRCSVFWMLAEFCAEFRLPFDLMIGPVRGVYPAGVAGGRDLFDRRVSLCAYRELFNAFPSVSFPVSTLAPDAAAELLAFAWIFPNVYPMGHWWYSNIPEFIARDLAARLQAVPKTKLLGYYSDAYKLEFILPKFTMYRRVLAEVLAHDSIGQRGWTETQALDVARRLLIENPRRIFEGKPGTA